VGPKKSKTKFHEGERMKRLFVFCLLTAVVAMLLPDQSEAYERNGYRYRVRHSHFSRGFARTYRWYGSYEYCYSDYRYGGYRHTCIDIPPHSDVFVQEQRVVRNGVVYTRVLVYRDRYDNDPYVEYYVSDGYVYHRRYYYNHYYYGRPYYHPHYRTYWVVDVEWDDWEEKLFWGTFDIVLGVDILADADTTGEVIIGGALIVLGAKKKAQGHEQRATELQVAIEQEKQDESAESFENVD
jgi:hypothetical protein